MATADYLFLTLPRATQRKIDRAFDAAASNSEKGEPPQKRRKPISAPVPTDSGGGFIVDTGGGFVVDDIPSGGGFIAEDEGAENKEGDDDDYENVVLGPTHVPMARIPRALRLLGLPTDDEQVLAVLRNAATGWGSGDAQGEDADALMVAREDWRAVCAVLLEHDADEDAAGESAGEEEGGSSGESDAYEDAGEEDEDEDDNDNAGSDDEYLDEPATRRRTRGGRKKGHESLSPFSGGGGGGTQKLTLAQARSCLETFALFFPPLLPSAPELLEQRIMIKDIQRVAKVLGEKIKAEEIVEMLEVFSTAPDKSMSYADFQTMMVATNMA